MNIKNFNTKIEIKNKIDSDSTSTRDNSSSPSKFSNKNT